MVDRLIEAFAEVDASGASTEALSDEQFRRGLYPLASQARAFAPERALVVGGRGTGKTAVFRALLSEEGRAAVVRVTGVRLSPDIARLVFVEGFGGGQALRPNAPAHPAADTFEAALHGQNIGTARRLWLGLGLGRLALEETVRPRLSAELGADLAALRERLGSPREMLRWAEEDVERPFALLERLDRELRTGQWMCVFTFDALDRAANSWSVLETAVGGLLSLALDVQRRSHAVRLKVFLRPDLESSGALAFPDASKLRGYREELAWEWVDLYRLLFKVAANAPRDEAARATHAFLLDKTGPGTFRDDRWLGPTPTLACDDVAASRVITALAGMFMGSDRRRGRTVTWVPNHLQDAHRRVAPRSFLLAWANAARWVRDHPTAGPYLIPSRALIEGVQAASTQRVAELAEDFPWIQEVADRLQGLEVPCAPAEILERLELCRFGEGEQRRGLRDAAPSRILEQLVALGVFSEYKGRYNVPDLYRLAMTMTRRGGIKLAR